MSEMQINKPWRELTRAEKDAYCFERRTVESLAPHLIERREMFIDGMLQGLTQKGAAIYAGAPTRSAAKVGAELMKEAYVIQRFAQLREAMLEEQLITKKELLLNVKSIAIDQTQQGSARVSASGLLTEIMGWKVNKMQITGAGGGPIQTVQLDPTKLSTEALNEILNAATAQKETTESDGA